MIEFDNQSHAKLMIRIVHTLCDNIYVDIEDAPNPRDITFKEQEKLTSEGWVIVDSHDQMPIEKMKEMT